MHQAHCDFDSHDVNTLKRFSVTTNKHLIQLLATYKQNGNYYLIFPWADMGLSNIHVYLPSQDKQFGRHNDIKHENVLWFRDNSKDAKEWAGQLKISDFGFVDFNSEGSRSILLENPVFTPTYRPPECAKPKAIISRSLDLWSLGCLYLEFVTWFLKGYTAATEEFTDERLKDGQHSNVPEFRDDNFFNKKEDKLRLKDI
ncbi:hypothetical protein LX32DRAFT_654999 [Colletotrichum zoysiae]|uniref:Protein kinase domain-containing protein n=1 Tax=Colletotrichum zoysiae TaxID=1216348 RepID=A0AAD9HCZ6_9PEZI|nr:hypothetical protein LX32DRAFT_654999 [Colletotrichum zoysiae]